MKQWTLQLIGLALGLALTASRAQAADYKTLRNLNAPPPVQLQPLPGGTKARPVQFVKAVVQPRNGEAWALAYYSFAAEDPDHPRPALGLLNWNAGRVQAETSSFARAFDEEMSKAGFTGGGGESLFGEGDTAADLKIGVLIDDMKGRFCADCPNLFNPKGVPATVVMTANWEVYSTLDRKVVLKVTTSGGADYKQRLSNSTLPVIYQAFRENVRLLMANDEFRRLVTAPVGPGTAASTAAAPALAPISFATVHATSALNQAPGGVAVVFASDGSGSGFLISSDGYLLTNHHVVGAGKYVKLKWSDGAETVGEVVRTDPRRDVALVKTDARGRAPLSLRHTGAQQGEAVYAIGAPLGEQFQNTMTKGIVSANRVQDGQSFIQSDVAVTHGNSGGPLLDEKGQVLGITDWGRLDESGLSVSLNFFIPIDDALRALALTPAPVESPQVAAAPAKGPAPRKR